MLRAQLACVAQLPNKSVQKLHARMRVLYHLAYPEQMDRSEIFLIERFIAALNKFLVILDEVDLGALDDGAINALYQQMQEEDPSEEVEQDFLAEQ